MIADKHYLAVGNYYDGSTHKLNSVIYQWNGHQFAVFQNIPTNGASSVRFFKILQEQFLAIANYKTSTSYRINSVIYKWKDNQFEKFQEIATVGAMGCTTFVINSVTFIAFANHYDHSYIVDSTVFKWSGARFLNIQDLQMTGAYNVKSFNINDDTFLAFANYRSGRNTFNVDSSIYKWDGSKFILSQLIPTRGAFGLHPFLICGETFLGVANWRDDSTGLNTKSVLYQYTGQKFIKYQEISTQAATDMKSFEYKGHTYLVITSEGNSNTLYKWV